MAKRRSRKPNRLIGNRLLTAAMVGTVYGGGLAVLLVLLARGATEMCSISRMGA